MFPTPQAFVSINFTTYHHRLGHHGQHPFNHLVSQNLISYKENKNRSLCQLCQLDKHVRLSNTLASYAFEIAYSDVLTSPVLSNLVINIMFHFFIVLALSIGLSSQNKIRDFW